MWKKSQKEVDHRDCKIILFKGKKRTLFIPCETRSINFKSSWLKIFALHKVEAFDIVLEN
jgi:hypothetical protein